jgi:16S rRNA (uracil1498-N3)-methyltransferase
MSNIRLFFSESLSINLNAKLDKSQSHYVNKVMRVKENETLSLFNESGEWEAKIKEISKGIVEFIIIKQLRQKDNEKDIWLAFSPIKSNYFNFMIQKATELGVTKFLPIIFDRTVVRKINKDRLQKIIIEAAEQSSRINVPPIEKPQNLKNFLSENKDKINLIFTDLNSQNKKLDSKELSKKPICLIVGPEGDFSESEREEVLSFDGVKPLKINENILRSETAAISAISIINYLIDL